MPSSNPKVVKTAFYLLRIEQIPVNYPPCNHGINFRVPMQHSIVATIPVANDN